MRWAKNPTHGGPSDAAHAPGPGPLPHARHRAALSGLKRSQTSATEKTGTPASRADWPTYCEIFRPQSVGYLPALGVSPAHLMILVAKSICTCDHAYSSPRSTRGQNPGSDFATNII
jgi:hypothetical protein